MKFNPLGIQVIDTLNEIVDDRFMARYLSQAITQASADVQLLSARIEELKTKVASLIGTELMDNWLKEALAQKPISKSTLVVLFVDESEKANTSLYEELPFSDPLALLTEIVDLSLWVSHIRAAINDARLEITKKTEKAERLTSRLYSRTGGILGVSLIEQALTRTHPGVVDWGLEVETIMLEINFKPFDLKDIFVGDAPSQSNRSYIEGILEKLQEKNIFEPRMGRRTSFGDREEGTVTSRYRRMGGHFVDPDLKPMNSPLDEKFPNDWDQIINKPNDLR